MAQRVYDYDNLFQAAIAVLKENHTLKDREEFYGNDNKRLEENLLVLQNDLLWNTYRIKPFLILDESGKIVKSELSIRDRIVQIVICNILSTGRVKDRWIKRLIKQFKSFSQNA